MVPVRCRLDFNWRDLVFPDHQKINLNIVLPIIGVNTRVEVQPVAGSTQRLRYYVFQNHPFIDMKLVE
jgi:hypothetical protein